MGEGPQFHGEESKAFVQGGKPAPFSSNVLRKNLEGELPKGPTKAQAEGKPLSSPIGRSTNKYEVMHLYINNTDCLTKSKSSEPSEMFQEQPCLLSQMVPPPGKMDPKSCLSTKANKNHQEGRGREGLVQLETTVCPLLERSVRLRAWTFYLGPDTGKPVHDSLPTECLFPAGKMESSPLGACGGFEGSHEGHSSRSPREAWRRSQSTPSLPAEPRKESVFLAEGWGLCESGKKCPFPVLPPSSCGEPGPSLYWHLHVW